jgi:hypothetical protein
MGVGVTGASYGMSGASYTYSSSTGGGGEGRGLGGGGDGRFVEGLRQAFFFLLTGFLQSVFFFASRERSPDQEATWISSPGSSASSSSSA